MADLEGDFQYGYWPVEVALLAGTLVLEQMHEFPMVPGFWWVVHGGNELLGPELRVQHELVRLLRHVVAVQAAVEDHGLEAAAVFDNVATDGHGGVYPIAR